MQNIHQRNRKVDGTHRFYGQYNKSCFELRRISSSMIYKRKKSRPRTSFLLVIDTSQKKQIALGTNSS